MADSVYIIAEAGVNHNGSLEMAQKLIDVAAGAGADAVKFQTFKAETLVSKQAEKADYQRQTTPTDESQYEMIKKLELDEDAHRFLINHCEKAGIQFLSTPFDMASVDLLARTFDLAYIKIPSGEITNGPLLLKIAQTGKPVILSTGMSTLGEIEDALGVLAFGYQDKSGPSIATFRAAYCSAEGQKLLFNKVKLLHCTTEYPAPLEDVNLKVMDNLKSAFGLPVGYSDHTEGIAVAIAAVARGAQIIEKHFTLDRTLPGPDHRASLEPEELQAMVRSIRQVEKVLGGVIKTPSSSEMKNLAVARKCLVAKRNIAAGEVFTEANIAAKRPGNGISPFQFWEVLGRNAMRDFIIDEAIEV